MMLRLMLRFRISLFLSILALVVAMSMVLTVGSRPAAADNVVVASGMTCWGLAEQHTGDGSRWRELYDLNAEIIEAMAVSHGLVSSDNCHWIFPPETVLRLPDGWTNSGAVVPTASEQAVADGNDAPQPVGVVYDQPGAGAVDSVPNTAALSMWESYPWNVLLGILQALLIMTAMIVMLAVIMLFLYAIVSLCKALSRRRGGACDSRCRDTTCHRHNPHTDHHHRLGCSSPDPAKEPYCVGGYWYVDVRFVTSGRNETLSLRNWRPFPGSNGWTKYLRFASHHYHLAHVNRRPCFGPDQVRCVCQIKNGLTYREMHSGKQFGSTITVMREPFYTTKDEGVEGWWIEVERQHDWGKYKDTISLQDHNIFPYSRDGNWNESNCLAFTDESRPLTPHECCCCNLYYHCYDPRQSYVCQPDYPDPARLTCMHQLKEGHKYEKVYLVGGEVFPFTVIKGPYQLNGHWYVDIRRASGRAESLLLRNVSLFPDCHVKGSSEPYIRFAQIAQSTHRCHHHSHRSSFNVGDFIEFSLQGHEEVLFGRVTAMDRSHLFVSTPSGRDLYVWKKSVLQRFPSMPVTYQC